MSLSELAERCEKAGGPDLDLDHAIWDAVRGEDDDGAPVYTRSLDAAMALVPEGCRVQLSDWDHERLRSKGPWQAILSDGRDHRFDAALKTRCDHAATPALALCAAALRARQESQP